MTGESKAREGDDSIVSNTDSRLMANLQQFTEGVERIRTLTQDSGVAGVSIPVPEQAKKDAIRDLYQHHKQIYELAQQKRQEVADDLSRARQDCFRYRTGLGNTEEVAISMRDANDRIDGITDPTELARRLEEAHELGDSVMSRAILRRAVSLGKDFGGTDLVRRYLSLYPGQQQAYERLQSASLEADRVEQWGVSGTILNPEDASRSFNSPGGGLIPENIITHQPEGQG